MNEPRIERFDVRGQICPSTLLLALREANRLSAELRSGEVELEIRTDNRNAIITIPNALDRVGLVARVSKDEQGYVIRIGREER